ncbi:uncharacterized protein LOC100877148 isoform X6 [Megachile rotundata]|uniref:uncharacterized protein LOC100877148 isoform X6 n=1 Tax=Megachile rotundata TaxID=143995 RepID=UPI0006152E95|nr:PREDICTED: uncharacterized protein LOC100877148 isoform X5 [Megachile rotundata]
MVKLTEEMVVARTRMSDFSAVKKLNCWYRMAVLRALPNLQKLDDKVVSPEEVQTALARGRILVHPLDMDASPPQSDTVSPEDIATEYIEETEVIRHRRYSSSSDQRSFEETQHAQEEYHDPDHRNANYNTSPSHHYSQNNQYTYELQNGQSKNESKDDTARTETRSVNESVATNTIEIIKEYDDRPAVSRHNGDYDERRNYVEYGNNDTPQRSYPPTSPRMQYSVNESVDDRRAERNHYDYDNRLKPEYEEHHDQRIKSDYEEHQLPSQPRRMTVHHNVERQEDSTQVPGWVRHSDKDKCRSQFHYHRRPVTRNSNILSAVLCLVKELDYPSLEVVEMAVRNRMDELEE